MISTIFDALALLFHLRLVFSDPGFIKNPSINFIKLLEVFEPESLCPECEIIRSARSKHCMYCK